MSYERQIRLFAGNNQQLFVSEAASSASDETMQIGPYIRNTFLLHIVTKGSYELPEFTATAGDAFLLCPDVIQRFTVRAPFANYWIGFSGSEAANLLRTFGIPTNRHSLLHLSSSEDALDSMNRLFTRLSAPNADTLALSALLSLFPYLTPTLSGVPLSYVAQARNYMDKHYQYPISMENVAQSINISEKHLCKLFKKETGLSPQQYLIDTRMQHARSLLLTTDMLISEVADNVGFHSQFAFSTAYKKHYKITPSEQRAMR